MIHAWYRIGSLFSNSCKSQTQFMNNLKELARQCEFTNKDEIVKFLFLIHNKHERVREELLKSVTKDTSLNQCLEFARCVEGNMQSEELFKKMGDNILDPQSIKVDAIKHKKAKCSQTPHRARNQSESSDDESHKSKIKCLKCGMKHANRKCPAFGKECFQCGKKNHFGKFCKGQVLVHIVHSVEFLFPIISTHIQGNYGHSRIPEEEYNTKKRLGTLTPKEKEDFEAPGPFSLVIYLKALIKRRFYGDKFILIIISMMWQV